MTTMTDPREVLSALVDGEASDADAVAAAIEVPANRTLLVDFIRLRASVLADDDTAAEWRPERLDRPETARARAPRAWLRAAAVLALLTAGAAGGTWLEDYLTRERPPKPSRVVQLQLVQAH
jgi:anti-sigma factor RsiW